MFVQQPKIEIERLTLRAREALNKDKYIEVEGLLRQAAKIQGTPAQEQEVKSLWHTMMVRRDIDEFLFIRLVD